MDFLFFIHQKKQALLSALIPTQETNYSNSNISDYTNTPNVYIEQYVQWGTFLAILIAIIAMYLQYNQNTTISYVILSGLFGYSYIIYFLFKKFVK